MKTKLIYLKLKYDILTDISKWNDSLLGNRVPVLSSLRWRTKIYDRGTVFEYTAKPNVPHIIWWWITHPKDILVYWIRLRLKDIHVWRENVSREWLYENMGSTKPPESVEDQRIP